MINQTAALKELRVAKFDSIMDWQMFSKLFIFSIISSLVFLMVYFVFQTNRQISESTVMIEGEKRVVELGELNNNLEINVASIKSMDRIIPLINNMNFEKSENVSFIRVPSDKVVVNKN